MYEIGEPRPGDIVMLYYPLNPEGNASGNEQAGSSRGLGAAVQTRHRRRSGSSTGPTRPREKGSQKLTIAEFIEKWYLRRCRTIESGPRDQE